MSNDGVDVKYYSGDYFSVGIDISKGTIYAWSFVGNF
jgi:hypothetical protein